LHEVVRDPSRNFLFNHLGLNEDAKIYLRPDCADLPYTLRAYFAHPRRGSDDYANALCGCAATIKSCTYDTTGRWISGPARDDPDVDPNAEWRRQRLLHYWLTGGYTRPW
jgi:hypothetical protein